MGVDNDGNLTVTVDGGTKKTIGKLSLVDVVNPQSMKRISANYFMPTENSETAKSEAQLSNRTLEGANVSPIRQMSHMVESVRVFNMEQKIMQMLNELHRSEQSKMRLG